MIRARHMAALALVSLLALSAPLHAQDAPRPVYSEVIVSSGANFRSFPGIVKATREVNLGFLASGSIETRPVRLGDAVTADAVIATLDEGSLRDDAVAARAALRAAEAQASMAQRAHERIAQLNRNGVAADSDLEAAKAARDTAAAAAEAARSTVARAEDAARYATLRAPAEGVITSIQAEPGMTVSAGQPIVTLAAGEGREAVIDVPTAFLPLFVDGMRFTVMPRMAGGQAVEGQLRLIEPVADRGARMHRVRVSLDEASLRLGSLVDVSPNLDEGKIVSVPASAIDQRDGKTRVWRIGANRGLEPVSVELGAEIEGRTIILSGISEGDEVLTRGILSANAGQIVGERISR